ncbi:Uncharacterized protein ALO57_04241 [Pseudomonas coronafaciens pv. oryzae]|nr:Uncharacterized protein ALO77_00904 [Pseudomonas coronafaciens pv. garcae]KPY03469.1 Uncharacterized protein ALO57_04241 [Pseudomonas coronafaciens pv. oryzae]RMM82154.1 hypothetical protein ALQ71_01738 [Pseudomonas coronafaciens pv. striafaciens]RMP31481.1 hypothetical protein ALQ25_01661 [Pseudomonas coronafaciens pv. atropurpurea]RMS92961.1 hypothetical protein ALP56_03883 [Pseudomonas coronafaciens pv. oryzae]
MAATLRLRDTESICRPERSSAMPSTTRRRDLYVSLKLIVCIALGIWLGAMAVFFTGMLYFKNLPPAQSQALENAAAQLTAPPAQKTTPPSEPETEMFRKYEQSLRESEARQAREQVQEQQQRTFSRSKCDFWIQQDRTAPSEKSRASIDQYCG